MNIENRFCHIAMAAGIVASLCLMAGCPQAGSGSVVVYRVGDTCPAGGIVF